MSQNSVIRSLAILASSIAAGALLCLSSAPAQQASPQPVQCATPTINLHGVDAMRPYKGQTSWQPNNQWAAGIVAPFAAASYDVYEDVLPAPNARALRLDDGYLAFREGKYGRTGWRRWTAWGRDGRTKNPDNGLVYDVYYRDVSPDRLGLMIAYRGTAGASGWVANFSWATQWFHRGQYQQAKEEFPKIIEGAQIELAKGRLVAVTTTGHSLGGGLARHVAGHYKCTSTVVFNSSFVTNTLRAQYTPPVQVFVYERGDWFESIISGNVTNTAVDATYRLTVSDIPAKHNMERLAVGATRMALDCDRNTPRCELPKAEASVSEALFCDRYVKLRYALGDEAQKRDMLKMRESEHFCPSHRDIPSK